MRTFGIAGIFCLLYTNGTCQTSLSSHTHDSLSKVSRKKVSIDSLQNNPISTTSSGSNKGITTTDAIAAIALLTSLASVVISYATYRIQRSHNIKSVKPILHVGQWDYESKLIVTLKNCGAGIAIVKRYSVYRKIDGTTHANIYDCLPSKLTAGLNYKEYWTPNTDFAVQPSQTIDLVHIPIDTKIFEQIEERQRLRTLLCELIVNLEFEDIYENKMTSYQRSLDWFARTNNINSSIIQ